MQSQRRANATRPHDGQAPLATPARPLILLAHLPQTDCCPASTLSPILCLHPTQEGEVPIAALCEALADRYDSMLPERAPPSLKPCRPPATHLRNASALLKHEVAFVLGQLEHPAADDALCAAVRCEGEHAMVCADVP